MVLAICSEADAFVAASLTGFSLTARLAFMVVGPMVDVKLVALQAGTFSRRFALVFAPLTFCSAVAASLEAAPGFEALELSPLNVRKVAPEGIEELAALIASQGLLQPLLVTAHAGDRAVEPR